MVNAQCDSLVGEFTCGRHDDDARTQFCPLDERTCDGVGLSARLEKAEGERVSKESRLETESEGGGEVERKMRIEKGVRENVK